jgi:hypothetical protein
MAKDRVRGLLGERNANVRTVAGSTVSHIECLFEIKPITEGTTKGPWKTDPGYYLTIWLPGPD